VTTAGYSLRGLALAITAILAITACTPTPAASPTPGASATTVASTRGAGGDLKILYWQAVTLLNPHLNQGTKDFDGSRLVIEPLAAMGPNGTTPVPMLAAEVPTVANGGISRPSRGS
jgi:peptide/nickel transport system substrate-binding protein